MVLTIKFTNPTSLDQESLNQQASRIKATHICKHGMLLTSNTVHTERNTRHTKKPLYSSFSRHYSQKTHFLCSSLPSHLIFCLFVGLRVFEGVWHFRNRSCLLGISVGKPRKRSVSVLAPQTSFSSWHREHFLAPFREPPGTASYLATLRLHQLESILLIFHVWKPPSNRIRPLTAM